MALFVYIASLADSPPESKFAKGPIWPLERKYKFLLLFAFLFCCFLRQDARGNDRHI